MSVIEVLAGLDPAGYRRHALHGEEAAWQEKNCYVDLWIELVHALKLEPLAMLPFTLGADFEDDQWTFFKPPLEELRDLYGIDVQELTVWRPLIDHAVEHLAAGRLISTEADAYWLPDTAGTDYRNKHTKTTIVLANLDVDGRKLGYFHNAGYFELGGEDFAQLFRLDMPADPAFLPLFAERIRIDRLVRRTQPDLVTASLALLRRHLPRRPTSNPFGRFGTRLAKDFPELTAGGLAQYHAWAFASLRQAGAAFELLASNLRWLAGFGHPQLRDAARSFDVISEGNKALILKGARAVHTGRALDASALLGDMARAWDEGMASLDKGLR
ncbi:DUF1839 family protein [Caenimonas soli]|uniref:DUF1839 family protein n=1 Tax=Caenimonas soli TaxID=2735555 RepID=UPI0015532085|nr:DUF1839 family protein [Caenimonas soli]NPC57358.1 DUF1839 family protein [Caenimonas soli]